ncbi:MAG: HD domain-containing protein [Frankiales bacterium]|nr:HD domain-containing protein [Frankiales bacterium]
MAAMSLACDTAMALPLETGLAICLAAMRLARSAGLDDGELSRTYAVSLLEHIGCTASSSDNAAVMGDELVLREHTPLLDLTDPRAMVRFMFAHTARVSTLPGRPMAMARMVVGAGRIAANSEEVCEAGRMLGARCGYDPQCLADLEAVYERWDGSGTPGRLAGDQIPVPVQVAQVATLTVNAERMLGAQAAVELVRARRGRALSPAIVDVLLDNLDEILRPLSATESLWEAVLAADPVPAATPAPADIDSALAAMADFADLHASSLVGHSSGVARLAGAAAEAYGLPAAEVDLVRRSGYVHDLGRVAVSAGVWNSAKPLTAEQREQVRMHPYYTQRVLGRSPYLRSLSEVASCHHERLDGSGYFRGATGQALGAPARILAAADAYHTKIEDRPHRAALAPQDAAAHLRAEADGGRLDRLAVDAVLAAVGSTRPGADSRLTARELEILVAAARGGSMRQLAKQLGIAPKTVDGHLQRIYPKIGVSTRTGATLFALEHGLLQPSAVSG